MNFEDVFFYLDLTKDFIKVKEVIKVVKYYIAEKNKINIKGHYGLLIFQEKGDPIFITDKKDSDIIENAIEENWKTRPKKQSFFENGLFYIFSYIAETIKKKSKCNRIIIITDTPSDLSEDYTEALFSLVSKIKAFPTFIDIIRVSEKKERFFKDDVKLNILASDTKGGIFYISDKKDFIPTIKKLVKNKQIVSIFENQHDRIKIKKDDYYFYSHLAKSLKPAPLKDVGLKCHFCQEEICPCCADVNDKLLVCEECGSTFHKCCVTNYTLQHNIGIPHIFRCPKCQILLKINQDDIVSPYDEKMESAEVYIETEEIQPDQLEESITASDYLEIEEPLKEKRELPDTSRIEESEAEKKAIRIGGFFGSYFEVKKEGDKLVYQKTTRPNNSKKDSQKVTNKSKIITEPKLKKVEISQYWKPLEKQDRSSTDKGRPSFFVCPGCGTHIKGKDKDRPLCPYCGFKLID
jgi:rubrerythrin